VLALVGLRNDETQPSLTKANAKALSPLPAKPLTKAAFCREEGITAAQFTYWCRRFDAENNSAEVISAPITLAQVSTPIQAVKELEERKLLPTSPETTSSFTQLHLPESPTPASTTSPAVSVTPLMVLDMAGKGRREFYTPMEASFLKALLS
jgi:transposase-like protein